MIRSLLRSLHQPIYLRRIRALSQLMSPWLPANASVLDVGCGSGALGVRLQADHPQRNLDVRGLEKMPREGAQIPVIGYDGSRFPFDDATVDVVILADVLHHEASPMDLLREAARVSRRYVLVKDHQVNGPLDHVRVSLLDYAANVGYGVPCLFRYPSIAMWRTVVAAIDGFKVADWVERMVLYPQPFQFMFGGRLHIFFALEAQTEPTPVP